MTLLWIGLSMFLGILYFSFSWALHWGLSHISVDPTSKTHTARIKLRCFCLGSYKLPILFQFHHCSCLPGTSLGKIYVGNWTVRFRKNMFRCDPVKPQKLRSSEHALNWGALNMLSSFFAKNKNKQKGGYVQSLWYLSPKTNLQCFQFC